MLIEHHSPRNTTGAGAAPRRAGDRAQGGAHGCRNCRRRAAVAGGGRGGQGAVRGATGAESRIEPNNRAAVDRTLIHRAASSSCRGCDVLSWRPQFRMPGNLHHTSPFCPLDPAYTPRAPLTPLSPSPSPPRQASHPWEHPRRWDPSPKVDAGALNLARRPTAAGGAIGTHEWVRC